MTLRALDPYVYKAHVQRVVDGDTVKLNLDMGFGDWKLATKGPLTRKEGRYPQGVYRLNGINTPEMREKGGAEARSRVEQLLALGDDPDSCLVRTTKHGKFRFLIDMYVPLADNEEDYDKDDERPHWLTESDLRELLAQTKDSLSDEAPRSTIRSLVTEILELRKQVAGGGVLHVNQQLIDEGYAKPYFGGRRS